MSREFYNEFDEWFEEIENYGQRRERFYGELPNNIALSDTMILWLRAAFECGQSGPQRQLDLLACGATVLTPSSVEHAQLMIKAAQRYIDYNKGKHDEQQATTSTDDSNTEQQPT